ncbi:uncharacterized protein L969DRAFT_89852 [Mixia osmundae IAM 14324]|uniref:Protein kinase domain-containing protein n=1 Tax=Mixia osmundae (strain CBS 9802 / IAM 14324 / JCM 22182 / KY 12970) TaxID=764103 RepID=G7DX54_MIXOS|nr:uncharacterized protein L969DRAFT_89852 [Mixia osmundae IAM 14324]KEI37301.1 hypothetical protein L969DRAFT_89852 [Mixia osmundae IAM 14324]GAA95164.1 hypothetical protein E5Q_01819 [Mixia osmundae IAM 14324]
MSGGMSQSETAPAMALRRSKNDIFGTSWRTEAPDLPNPTPAPPWADAGWQSEPRYGSKLDQATLVQQNSVSSTTPRRSWLDSPLPKVDRAVPPVPIISLDLGLLTPHSSDEPGLLTPGSHERPSLPDILPSSSSVKLRLYKTRQFWLGSGRHADVFLSSYAQQAHGEGPGAWQLCAAKQVHMDRESQLEGLTEAFIMGKLGKARPPRSRLSDSADVNEPGRCYLLGLLGVKSELDGVESEPNLPGVALRSQQAAATSELGLGLPKPKLSLNRHLRHLDVAPVEEMQLRTAEGRPRSGSLGVMSSHHSRAVSGAMGRTHVDAERHQIPRAVEVPLPPGVHADSHAAPLSTSLQEPYTPIASGSNDAFLPLSDDRSSLRRSESARQPASFHHPRGQRHGLASIQSAHEQHPHETRGTSQLILLLEYCPHGSLYSLMRAEPTRLSRKMWFRWAIQLASAIACCHHRGILHADIKPQNVLLAADWSVRLSDFGASRPISRRRPLPDDPIGLGTTVYNPPELVRPPPSSFSFEADIFALGVTFNTLIVGGEPYRGISSPVEQMLWVLRGGYWEWEERQRLMMGTSSSRASSVAGTPKHSKTRTSISLATEALSRKSSVKSSRGRSDSLQTDFGLNDLGNLSGSLSGSLNDAARFSFGAAATPSTGAPIKQHISSRLVATLLRPEIDADESREIDKIPSPISPTDTSRRSPISPLDDAWSDDQEHLHDDYANTSTEVYSDHTPLQYFLDGVHVVPESLRELLRSMTSPQAQDRPTIDYVCAALDSLATLL